MTCHPSRSTRSRVGQLWLVKFANNIEKGLASSLVCFYVSPHYRSGNNIEMPAVPYACIGQRASCSIFPSRTIGVKAHITFIVSRPAPSQPSESSLSCVLQRLHSTSVHNPLSKSPANNALTSMFHLSIFPKRTLQIT